MDTLLEKIARCRLLASELMPYMSAMLYYLIPMEFKGCPTMGVTQQGVLVYNPAFLQDLSDKQTAAVLLHEALHLMSEHYQRQIDFVADPKRWNIAADAEINDDLFAAGVSLPRNCVLPWLYNLPANQLAEFYYRKLQEMDPADLPQVQCGSGAGNPFEEEPSIEEQVAGDRDAALERAIYDTAKAAQRYQGTVPGGIKILIDKILPVDKVNWQSVLTSFVCSSAERTRGLFDLTYGRLSRRQRSGSRIVLPAYYRPNPTLGVLVDTSGSMSEQDLRAGLGAIKNLFNYVSDVWLCVVDAAIHDLRKCRSVEDIAASLTGGGGTDFSEAIPSLDKLCDFMVGISDCYATYPNQKPSHDILWLVTGEGSPPWGKAVKVD